MLERNHQLQQTEQLQRARKKLQSKRHIGPKGTLILERHGTPIPPPLKSQQRDFVSDLNTRQGNDQTWVR